MVLAECSLNSIYSYTAVFCRFGTNTTHRWLSFFTGRDNRVALCTPTKKSRRSQPRDWMTSNMDAWPVSARRKRTDTPSTSARPLPPPPNKKNILWNLEKECCCCLLCCLDSMNCFRPRQTYTRGPQYLFANCNQHDRHRAISEMLAQPLWVCQWWPMWHQNST